MKHGFDSRSLSTKPDTKVSGFLFWPYGDLENGVRDPNLLDNPFHAALKKSDR